MTIIAYAVPGSYFNKRRIINRPAKADEQLLHKGAIFI